MEWKLEPIERPQRLAAVHAICAESPRELEPRERADPADVTPPTMRVRQRDPLRRRTEAFGLAAKRAEGRVIPVAKRAEGRVIPVVPPASRVALGLVTGLRYGCSRRLICAADSSLTLPFSL